MCGIAAAAFGLCFGAVTLASAACIEIKVPADLNKIRKDSTGSYCLAADLDFQAIPNFAPLGSDASPFMGSFDGRNHTIRNLRMSSGLNEVGLFGLMTSQGSIRNLTLENVRVNASADNSRAGVLIGTSNGAIGHVRVGGSVACQTCVRIGGLAGEVGNGGSVSLSSSRATVRAGIGADVGGLVGALGGDVIQSYATGAVSTAQNSSSFIGGLVGLSNGSVKQCFATGPVSSRGNTTLGANIIGGLIGENDGSIVNSFAVGAVTTDLFFSAAGGLAGKNGNGKVRNSYALGPLLNTSTGPTGGLVGAKDGFDTLVASSYWDTETTKASRSEGGTGRTTAALQAHLPTGWSGWTLTPGVSFPYYPLGLDFWAPLAITVQSNLLYTFLPISEFDNGQYAHVVTNEDKASRAAVFTMLARAVGVAQGSATLTNAKIDQYFNATSGQAVWTGPITTRATLGPQLNIAAAEALTEANVIGPLRARKLVILRGTYKLNGHTFSHYLLGTSFTVASGKVTSVVADDPYTGKQVRIDLAATGKNVIGPGGLPARELHGERLAGRDDQADGLIASRQIYVVFGK